MRSEDPHLHQGKKTVPIFSFSHVNILIGPRRLRCHWTKCSLLKAFSLSLFLLSVFLPPGLLFSQKGIIVEFQNLAWVSNSQRKLKIGGRSAPWGRFCPHPLSDPCAKKFSWWRWGQNGVSSLRRPGSEDPHRRQQKLLSWNYLAM
jgi:hypothetical protein